MVCMEGRHQCQIFYDDTYLNLPFEYVWFLSNRRLNVSDNHHGSGLYLSFIEGSVLNSSQILHEGNRDDCFHAPWLLPW